MDLKQPSSSGPRVSFNYNDTLFWMAIKSNQVTIYSDTGKGCGNLTYSFPIGEEYTTTLRTSGSKSLDDKEEIFAYLKDDFPNEFKQGFNCFIRFASENRSESLELFIQHTQLSKTDFAAEIQCKLQFSNGYKNDQILYINHLIPNAKPVFETPQDQS